MTILKRLPILVISILAILSTTLLFAQDSPLIQSGPTPTLNDVVSVIAELEIREMNETLDSWVDPALIEEPSRIELTDDYVKDLYQEFQKTVVTPPNPETYSEYSIDNGEENLAKTTDLGKRIHNHFFAFSGEKIQRYGPLLALMRDVLLVDSMHIPLAIKHDNSRDIYWYDLHRHHMQGVEKEFNALLLPTTAEENAPTEFELREPNDMGIEWGH